MKRIVSMIVFIAMMAVTFTACGTSDKTEKETEKETYAGPTGSLSEIIDAIYKIKDTGLSVGTMEQDLKDADMLKYNTGLTSADQISEVSISEAMISSQAYSMVLVRVKDAADTEEVAQKMLEGIDPAKWICVQADDVKAAGCNDLIMLVMVSTELADTVTADSLIDAFKEVCEGHQDFLLK